MSASAKTFVLAVNATHTWNFDRVPDLGDRLKSAFDEFDRTRQPVLVTHTRHGFTDVIGSVIGGSMADTAACYVVQEHSGALVSPQQAEKAHLDAMVNVLRAHGYTCIRRGS